ncbi:LysE family translocator [Lacinutrix undariae]
MLDYNILISFVVSTLVLAFSPGPDNIYVLMQSVVNGKKYGLATVCGLISGCLVHTSLVAFGVSAIIKNNDALFFSIKLLGAIYLLYLAFKVFKSDAHLNLNADNIQQKSLGALYKQGFIMNVLNPKVSIFFLAFFPGFLFSTELNIRSQFFILGGLFMFVSFIVFALIAVLAALISTYIKQHKNVGVLLKWLQVIVFIGIAIFILLSEK